MGWRDVTRDGVLAAIREYDDLGPDRFRADYGYGRARTYELVHDGRSYDSKAIVGVAHKLVDGNPLKASEFSGGEATVRQLLTGLGFRVRRISNPDWARDEVILACALVAGNDWRSLSATDPRVIELSGLLQRLPLHTPADRGETFRNPNGVARKTADIATIHPAYTGRRTRGGRTDQEVLGEFLKDAGRMLAAAAAIRGMIASGTVEDAVEVEDLVDEDFAAPEGRLLLRQHLSRERNRALRDRKVKQVRSTTGRVACEACGFDFEAAYGPRGEGYIECHHVVPLHEAGERTSRLNDLALLCANCHRVLHRQSPWLTPSELAALVARHRV